MIKKIYNGFKKLAIIFTLSALMFNITTFSALAAENINENYRGMMGNWDWGDMMGFGFGGLMMGVFWIFVILAGLAFFRWFIENQKNSNNTSDRAMEILKEKYAKGEITKEEFETKKKDIM